MNQGIKKWERCFNGFYIKKRVDGWLEHNMGAREGHLSRHLDCVDPSIHSCPAVANQTDHAIDVGPWVVRRCGDSASHWELP